MYVHSGLEKPQRRFVIEKFALELRQYFHKPFTIINHFITVRSFHSLFRYILLYIKSSKSILFELKTIEISVKYLENVFENKVLFDGVN